MPTTQEKLEFLKTNSPESYARLMAGMGYSTTPATTTPKPTATPQPVVQPQAQVQPQTQTGGVPPVDMSKYAGWTDQAAIQANWAATWQEKMGQDGGGMGISTPQTINLPELYKGLYESSGVSKLESEYSDKEKAFNEAQKKINDNPFMSEATRVGRLQKLQLDFTNATANLQKDIATKKADIETQLNLQTKQFDINSQVATNALNQLNSLLSMGALADASGETIANLTRSTGISSDMIYSAIEASKKKNTQVITSTAENGEMFAVVLNSDTGEIIKKTSLGTIGNVQGGSGGGESGIPSATELKNSAIEAANSGKTYEDMLAFFRQYGMTPKQIYDIYVSVGYYGRPPDNVDSKTGEYITE